MRAILILFASVGLLNAAMPVQSLLRFANANKGTGSSSDQTLFIDWDFTWNGSGQIITNTASVTPNLKSNIVVGAQNLFETSKKPEMLNIESGFTDGYATAPDGTSTATRYVHSGGASTPLLTIFPAAGITTLSCWVKRNTGSDQTMRFSYAGDGGSQFSSDFTVTASWVRQTWTFTADSTTYFMGVTKTAATPADLDVLVWGVQVQPGSVATDYIYDTNYNAAIGVDRSTDAADPTWASTSLRFDDSKYLVSTGQRTFTNASVYVAFKEDVITNEYAPLFGSRWGDTSDFAVMGLDNSGDGRQPSFRWGGTVVYSSSGFNDGLWHIATATYDGTDMRLFIDGMMVARKTASPSSISPPVLQIGNTANYNYLNGNIARVQLYAVAHDAATVTSKYETLKSFLSGKSITVTNQTRLLAFEGDSITAGYGNYPAYRWLVAQSFTPKAFGPSLAVAGNTLSDLNSRAALLDSFIVAGRSNVLFVLDGHNDIVGGTPTPATNWVASYKTYCNARKAAGWKVVIGTLLPSSDSAFNTQRNIANILLKADSSFYDGLADFAANSTIGDDADGSNTTYYPEATHPSVACHAILAPICKTAVQTLLGL